MNWTKFVNRLFQRRIQKKKDPYVLSEKKHYSQFFSIELQKIGHRAYAFKIIMEVLQKEIRLNYTPNYDTGATPVLPESAIEPFHNWIASDRNKNQTTEILWIVNWNWIFFFYRFTTLNVTELEIYKKEQSNLYYVFQKVGRFFSKKHF